MNPVIENPQSQEPAVNQVEGYEQRVASLSPKDKARWDLTGELPVGTAVAPPDTEIDVTPASSPGTSEDSNESESGAAPDPAIEEQTHVGETPEQKSDRKKRNDHSRYVREKTRADMLERQLAELKAASAPAVTPAVKPVEKPTERPKRPRMKDFSGEFAADDFDAAMDKYETDLETYDQSRLEQRLGSAKQEISTTADKTVRYARAREKFADYDAVAFSDKTPATWTVIHVLDSMENGAELRYQIGKDLALATKLAELTFIPGEDKQDAAAFRTWLNASPSNAILFGEKIAAAKAELAKLSKPKAAPTTNSSRPRPTGEVQVEPKGAPVTDPISEAIRKGDFETYERLANAEDVARRR